MSTSVDATPIVEAARELRGRFYHLIDSLSALRALTELETRHQPEAQLLERALVQLLGNEDFAHSAVHVWHEGSLQLVAEHGWPDTPALVGGEIPRARAWLVGKVAQTGSAARWDDCATECAAVGLPTMNGSMAAVPILSRGEFRGVLSVWHPHAGHLQPWQEHSLTLFCNVLGAMLENNRLLNEMEQAVKTRTRQLEVALREAEQLKIRYEQLSNIDELTGLHNRRYFFPETEAMLARSLRYGHPFSLILADVDHFKMVNDTAGHAVGDRVLRDVATELHALIRDGDIIARFGGEEFIIALPSTDLGGAMLLADRVRERVAGLAWERPPEESLQVTLSLGVTSLRGRQQTNQRTLLDELLKEADAALYAAKTNGRDRVRCHEPTPATADSQMEH